MEKRMAFEFKLPGSPKTHPPKKFNPTTSKQRAGLGSDADNISDISDVPRQTDEVLRYDNLDEIEHAFKQGALTWPDVIEVKELKYRYFRSFKKEIVDIFKGKRVGYIIYHIPKEHTKKAAEYNMGHWMVFLLRPKDPSNMIPQGIAFTSTARGNVLYEEQQVIGDVALLKIALPSGVIALKGKVDTGADISSLHVDSTPKIIGDVVKFENHNASGNVISAPLVAKQAVKIG